MKKATYFFSALCVALFCSLPLSAQIYTETMHRTTLIAGNGGLCHGGTYVNSVFFSEVKATVRGVEQFDRTFVNAYSGGDFNLLVDPGMNNPGNSDFADAVANAMPGNLALDYVDCTNDCVIEVVAGQDFTIETLAGGHTGWANATLFVDWDGNGVFDDHDIDEYNLYGFSNFAAEEGAGNGAGGIKPKWTVKVPADYPVEKTVRVRMRIDESIDGAYKLREFALSKASSIYGATNGGCNPSVSAPSWLAKMHQYFYSMYLYRFTPTGQFYKGTTVDVALKITPNPYSDASVTGSQLITATGSVACTTNNGTAITNQSEFASFLANPSGDYYLANDITLTSVPTPSCKEFTGTFDGNGHTITYPAAASVATPGVLSKDECFYPYALNYDAMRTQLLSFDQKTGTMDMSNYPQYDICGGFCGKLAHSGTIKNVKVVYSGAVTYDSNKQQVLFGLVAGIAKGRVENVSVDIQQPVQVQMTVSGRPSAVGGIAGILFGGIIKNCDVNVDNSFAINTTSGYAFETSALGGFVGRLQSGVIGNVKFSGNASGKLILHVDPASTYTMNYIGGIAGMTNTPKSIINGYARTQYLYWGYDNGSTGLDVNNVILAYNGSMEMTQAATGASNFYCRGLLFGEACDTATVPNLITQYAARPTIEADCSNAQALSGTNIPLISKPLGSCNSTQGAPSTKRIGELYLYKDGRNPVNSSNCQAFTNINVNDTKLDWAYEVQTLSDGSCVSFSTPYAVATNTSASAASIENASANVSDLGSAVVKIDPQPATTPNPSWTWSNAATPTTPAVEPPVCGGRTPAPMPTYCAGNQNGSYNSANGYYGIGSGYIKVNGVKQFDFTTSEAIEDFSSTLIAEVNPGDEITIGVNGYDFHFQWSAAVAFFDWNMDGTWHETQEKYTICDNDGNSAAVYREKTVTVPNTTNCGYFAIRITSGESTVHGKVSSVTPCSTLAYGKLTTIGVKVACTDPVYCDQPTFKSDGNTTPPATGYLKNLSANGTALATNWSFDKEKNVTGNTITINQGEILSLDMTFDSQHTSNMQYTTALVFVDLNGDGDFRDSGERIYAKGGVGWQNSAIGYEWLLVDGISNDKPWETTKTVTFASGVTQSMLRIYTVGEWGSKCEGNTSSKSISTSGCPAGTDVNGDKDANRFHCYDFPIVINSAVGGDCAYVANFGDVYEGDVVTYDISLGAGSVVNIDADVADDEYKLAYNNATGKLTVTYNVPAALGAVSVNSIGAITKDGDKYRIAVSATVKAAPTVTFRIGENGGGFLSLDMGKTTSYLPYEIYPYKGQLLTAVPQGPCAIEGWYVSTDGGTTFNAVGHTNPDYTYTGADDAIVEVRFKFEDFDGDFGNSRFTKNTNLPFYISSIKTDGGIVNVNAVQVFNDATVVGGSAHLNYLTDQRLQTLTYDLTKPNTMEHNISVTVHNASKIPANARLLCFIDYDYNGWFDFASSADGLASSLSKNNELVYVGEKSAATDLGNDSIIFQFKIDNAKITKYGKTRMRFMVATYVDMYGLGPVNQYGNYQPRLDTDGDGVADAYLPLNDSKGELYTPNNECRYENYINVADVNFEVVAYIKAEDTYKIAAGTTTRMGDLYIESVEDGSGIHSGRIIFDKGNPTGSLQVEGNIVVRKRIYQDRWHHVAFPIAMQGSSGTKGICAVDANGGLHKLPDNKWLLYTFNPELRNNTAGNPGDSYNTGTIPVAYKDTLAVNTFYEFAADNVGGASLNKNNDPKGVDYYWIQFHSKNTGFHITAKSAQTVEIGYTRMEGDDQYWNRNVFTIYNPYLSPIDVREITASVGWENITWKNAYHNRYEAVSAATKCDMPPYFGYWVQFTEGIGSGTSIKVTLGDPNRLNYASADDAFVTVTTTSTTGVASSFDTPDAYTLGIDRAAATLGKQAASRTIVTLTDVGSVDEFRAGYDMPVSYADATSTVPEIWSKAGSSRMMFNDVMRDNEVVVPVGIRIKEAGEYVIRLTDTNFAESLVQLYDKQTGARVDLQRNGELFSYNFLADAGDADSRFDLIIIAPESMTDLEVIEQDEVPTAAAIYKAGSTLRIVNMPLGYTVSVCDVIGREVLHTTVVDADMQLELPNSQGVYLVNVRNEKGAAVQVLKLAR